MLLHEPKEAPDLGPAPQGAGSSPAAPRAPRCPAGSKAPSPRLGEHEQDHNPCCGRDTRRSAAMRPFLNEGQSVLEQTFTAEPSVTFEPPSSAGALWGQCPRRCQPRLGSAVSFVAFSCITEAGGRALLLKSCIHFSSCRGNRVDSDK